MKNFRFPIYSWKKNNVSSPFNYYGKYYTTIQRDPVKEWIESRKSQSSLDVKSEWTEFHKTTDCLYASVDSNIWSKLQERMVKWPCFILPLPRETHLWSIFWRVVEKRVGFMSVEDFQKSAGENVRPMLLLEFYDDFFSSHKLVLLRGNRMIQDKLTLQEAQYLGAQFQRYYLDDRLLPLVKTCNETPELFDYNAVVAEFRNSPTSSKE